MEYIDQLNTYETQVYFASQNTKRWSPMKQNMTSPKYHHLLVRTANCKLKKNIS